MYDRGVVHVLCMSVSWGGSPVPKKRHPFHASGVQKGRELKDLKGYENLLYSYLKGPIIKIFWTETPYLVCKNNITLLLPSIMSF